MLVLTAALLLSVPAAADSVTITLASPFQVGAIGSTVSFTATVSAPITNSAAIFLNGDSFNVDAPLWVDDSGFLAFPTSMNPGDSATGVLFAVNIPMGTPFGDYFGYFQITGGSDGSQLNPISNVGAFEIYAVPEPGGLMMLGSGVLGIFGVARRKLM
jgi:hypothetical protein